MLGNENDNANADSNIIFTIKDTKFYVPVVTFSAKNYQNFLAKDLKDRFIGMNIKPLKIKMQQMSIDIFLNQAL